MRKFFGCVILTLIFMFVGMISADAATLTPSAKSVSVGGSFTLSVKNVISGYEYSLDFKEGEKYFDVSKNTCGNRTSITSDCEITLSPKNSLSLTSNQNVIFTLSETADNDATTTATITILANKSGQSQTPQQPSNSTTTTTTAPRSNNANLASINITTNDDETVTLSPSFSANVYTYSASVASTVRTVNVDARLEDSRANMIVTGADDELVAGENNEITITVTAEDGTKKAYTINITREALTADATLSDLTIEECEDFEFQEDKFTYNVKIGRNVDSLTLEYTLSDENATVEIDGNENLKNGSKVRITVTAEDGTKRVYTLNIQKETTTTKKNNTVTVEDKNPLIIMGLSVIAFGLVGGIIYVIKR